MILTEPLPIPLKVNTPKEMAWVVFHEGFRAAAATALRGPLVTPSQMELHIRSMYEEFLKVLERANK